MDCSLPGFSVHGDSPDKNTGVDCCALFQGIFPTQESNPALLHCRWILYHLSHQGAQKDAQSEGFEPAQGDPIGFLVYHLNHLAMTSSLTRDQTQTLSSESLESQPLDCQGIP